MDNRNRSRLTKKTKYTKVEGEANIYGSNEWGTFRVKMTRKGTTFDKTFKTLEEAKKFRLLVYEGKVPIMLGRSSRSGSKKSITIHEKFEFGKRLYFFYDLESSQVSIGLQLGKIKKKINMPMAKVKELRSWLTSAIQTK